MATRAAQKKNVIALHQHADPLAAAAPELLALSRQALVILPSCAKNARKLGQYGFEATLEGLIAANTNAVAKAEGK